MAPSIGSSVPVALQALSAARTSGILTVRSGDRSARFAMHWGQFLYANCDVLPRLGDTMVAKGLLTTETLERVLETQRKSRNKRPLGTLLHELELIDRVVARAELEEQIFLVLREVLSWEEGTYAFLPLAEHACADVILPGCSLDTHLFRIAASKAG